MAQLTSNRIWNLSLFHKVIDLKPAHFSNDLMSLTSNNTVSVDYYWSRGSQLGAPAFVLHDVGPSQTTHIPDFLMPSQNVAALTLCSWCSLAKLDGPPNLSLSVDKESWPGGCGILLADSQSTSPVGLKSSRAWTLGPGLIQAWTIQPLAPSPGLARVVCRRNGG